MKDFSTAWLPMLLTVAVFGQGAVNQPSLEPCEGVQECRAFEGKILDSEGAGIGGARVLVHWDSSGRNIGLKDNVGVPHDVAATTNATGHFSIVLPPGFYDLFFTAPGFTPVAGKFRVKMDKPYTVIHVALHADRQVTKELGDEFH